MGKAVVSTTEGVGSLLFSEGDNILVRDTPQAFADAVIDLLQDPVKATQLGDSGRRTIVGHYTWSAKARELEALMEQIVRGRSSREKL